MTQGTIRLICCAALATCVLVARAWGELVVYPAPQGIAPATDYQVQVNGKDVFVYSAPIASLAAFDLDGQVEVTIKANRDVKWVDIRHEAIVPADPPWR